MSSLGMAEAVRLARRARAGGGDIVLAAVVAAPGDPTLVGRRLALDEGVLRGSLGDPEADGTARELLADAPREPGCRRLPGSDVELYVETVGAPDELVVVGAGHLARPLVAIGALLGWRVTVLDDRPAFAETERFPEADRVVVADFDDPFADVPVGERTRIVLVTRGHRYDYDCLRALASAGVEPAYVGMIGSRRRVRAAFEALAAEGIDPAWLERVHAPIGLDVGAETPAEIAVAVAAEMVRSQRGGSGRPLKERAGVIRRMRARAARAEEARA